MFPQVLQALLPFTLIPASFGPHLGPFSPVVQPPSIVLLTFVVDHQAVLSAGSLCIELSIVVPPVLALMVEFSPGEFALGGAI